MAEPTDSADFSIRDLLTRLERERQDADRRYNDALTAVNQALHPVPALPAVPQPLQSSAQVAQAALLEQVRQALGGLVADVKSEAEARFRFESLLVQCLMAITAFVDTKDRALGGSELRDRLAMVEERLMAVKRELDRRPVSGGSAPSTAPAGVFAANVDASAYVGFEDRFRGERDEIRRRVEDYVPLLAEANDVVDIGCGRGELLDLLGARGVRARGVDVNEAMAAQCRARGLDVEHGDALSYLERQPDASIGGLIAVQVVEHFKPAYLARFLEAAYQKMRGGAPLILETLNPACWMAFFETYVRDLTHEKPLHPETLRYLVEASGFTRVDVQYRQPVREADRLERVDGMEAADPAVARVAAALNAHADKLNDRLFSSMDYVVTARR